MHISSTFYLSITAGFLNGDEGDDISRVKQYEYKGKSYPYVSAQALRKWIRTTVNHLTGDYSYYHRVKQSSPNKKQMKKPEGLWIDPVHFIEDDLFGYSHPFYNSPDQEDKKHLNIGVTNRYSPFQTTAMISLPETAAIRTHDGWVRPDQDSSLPFETEMMFGMFQTSATLDLNRIGRFRQYGDTIELDPFYQEYYLEKGKLRKEESNGMSEYLLQERNQRVTEATSVYYDSIMNLYGAPKSTILASDLSPRILITAVLKHANNLFYDIVHDRSGELEFDVERLLQRLDANKSILCSDIFIGYRSGTLKKQEEQKIKEMDGTIISTPKGNKSIRVSTPGKAALNATQFVEENV